MYRKVALVSGVLLVNITLIFIILYFLGLRVRVTSAVTQYLVGKSHAYSTSSQRPSLEPASPIHQVTWKLEQQRFVGVITDSGLGNKLFSIATAYGFCIRNGLPPPLVFYQNSARNCKITEWGGHDIGEPTFPSPEVPRRLKDVFPYIRFADVTDVESIPGMFSGSAVFGEITEEDYLTPLPAIDVTQANVPEAYIFRGLWFAPVQFLEEQEILRKQVFVFHPSIEKYVEAHYEEMIADHCYTAIHLRLGHPGDTFEMPFPSPSDMQRFLKGAGVDKFVVFTDNRERAKKLLLPLEGTFKYDFISDLPFVEMSCMRRLKNFLISRSTFSWWGAFLMNKTEDTRIVVCRDVVASSFVLMHHCFETMMSADIGWTVV
jgi:hypothetical protein